MAEQSAEPRRNSNSDCGGHDHPCADEASSSTIRTGRRCVDEHSDEYDRQPEAHLLCHCRNSAGKTEGKHPSHQVAGRHRQPRCTSRSHGTRQPEQHPGCDQRSRQEHQGPGTRHENCGATQADDDEGRNDPSCGNRKILDQIECLHTAERPGRRKRGEHDR